MDISVNAYYPEAGGGPKNIDVSIGDVPEAAGGAIASTIASIIGSLAAVRATPQTTEYTLGFVPKIPATDGEAAPVRAPADSFAAKVLRRAADRAAENDGNA